MEPIFLTLEEVLETHIDQVTRYGGAPGIRDLGLLKAAIAMPPAMAGTQFIHEDLPAMAAAYLFHLIHDHPFIDGNRRVAATCAVVFLLLNGVELEVGDTAFEEVIRAVAKRTASKDEIANFFRAHSRMRV